MFGYINSGYTNPDGFKMEIGENIRVGDIVSPGVSAVIMLVQDIQEVDSMFGVKRYKLTYQPLNPLTGAKEGGVDYGYATSIMPFKVWAPAKFAKHGPIDGEGLGGPELDETVWGGVATALARHDDMHGENDSDWLRL